MPNTSGSGSGAVSLSDSVRSSTSSNIIVEETSTSRNHTVTIGDNNGRETKRKTKDLLCIRHGVSLANEFMSLPDNKWGSPSFRDDPKLIDAPLSENGVQITKTEVPRQLLHQDDLRSFLVGTTITKDSNVISTANDGGEGHGNTESEYSGVELVLISPLTRCLQTYMYGVEPVLWELLVEQDRDVINHYYSGDDDDHDNNNNNNNNNNRNNSNDNNRNNSNDNNNNNNNNHDNPLSRSNLPIPVLALPLLRERVYLASDTGRPISVLEKEFPSIDFSECHKSHNDEDDDRWWYTGTKTSQTAGPLGDSIIWESDSKSNTEHHIIEEGYEEWRPHGEGQWYAVPGEPNAVFDRRMEELKEWLSRRKETKILLVAHWGVLRYLGDGVEWKNSEAKIIQLLPRS
jgi:hypothetical protein